VPVRIGTARTLFLSGIVRDFQASHPDFARTNGDSTRPLLVQNNLDSTGKPQCRPSGATATVSVAASFNQ